MKSAWQVSRRVIERADEERRWDFAYQLLLQWAMENEAAQLPIPLNNSEANDESSSVHACFHQSPKRGTDD